MSDLGSSQPELFEVMKWPDFLRWFLIHWEPGQHVALVGPTGGGKTTFVTAILPERKYVMALDPKGGDTNLAKLIKESDFERVDWPVPRHHWWNKWYKGKDMWQRIEEGESAHIIVGRVVNSMDEFPKLARMLARALYDSFANRGWTVYIDELQLAADRRLMKLGRYIELNLIAARDRGVSMVMSFQRPANVPRSAGEMSTWFVVFYTRDKDTVRRVAEMAGRPYEEVQGMLRGIPEFHVLLFSRNPRQPVIITKVDLNL
jgi:energy-coupling factor transporter ATP-binding protein EcfA2